MKQRQPRPQEQRDRPPCTFVQPVAEAIVNHAFLPSGDHADGLLPDVRAVVDVVFKDKYLIGKRKNAQH